MKKFISKPVIVEAEQFLPPYQIPEGIFNVYEFSEGIYSGQVWTIQGERVNVKSGEWIVRENDNPKRFYPVADNVFIKKYALVNEKRK